MPVQARTKNLKKVIEISPSKHFDLRGPKSKNSKNSYRIFCQKLILFLLLVAKILKNYFKIG